MQGFTFIILFIIVTMHM